MATPEELKKVMTDVVAMLKSAQLPAVMAKVVFPKTNKPISTWSLSNRLLCCFDYLHRKYPSQMKHLPREDRSKFIMAHIEEALTDADYRGFKQWKDIGRHVTKDENSTAYILAPLTKKGERKYVIIDGEKHHVYYDPADKKYYRGYGKDKTLIDKYETEPYTFVKGFRLISVFEAEQTTGKAIVNKELKLPQLPFKPVADFLGIKIIPKSFSGNAYGSYDPHNKVIQLATPNEVTFFHELAHAVDGYLLEKSGRSLKGGQHSDQKIVAQFCAQVIAHVRGYRIEESAAYTKHYIKHYSEGDDIEEAIIKLMARCEQIVEFILNFKEAKSPNRQAEEKSGEPKMPADKLADDASDAKKRKIHILKYASKKAAERGYDAPESGKVYALTGGNDEKSIAAGNTWKESEVGETIEEYTKRMANNKRLDAVVAKTKIDKKYVKIQKSIDYNLEHTNTFHDFEKTLIHIWGKHLEEYLKKTDTTLVKIWNNQSNWNIR
ncbi:hypothetical protein [Candidatus Magnetobacterium casense]|uniref:Antirestriction protein n=1 Tax=Candidatus Magnetobacterium casense TaxID=1455061 RepID=A0ABS6RV83_9BACT|nr:hypothetical protein [Candidatus Magnetobacterium casensis]MBV6340357.1 hypothetical protein [Candidatus Magnetobacterium casensis]